MSEIHSGHGTHSPHCRCCGVTCATGARHRRRCRRQRHHHSHHRAAGPSPVPARGAARAAWAAFSGGQVGILANIRIQAKRSATVSTGHLENRDPAAMHAPFLRVSSEIWHSHAPFLKWDASANPEPFPSSVFLCESQDIPGSRPSRSERSLAPRFPLRNCI